MVGTVTFPAGETPDDRARRLMVAAMPVRRVFNVDILALPLRDAEEYIERLRRRFRPPGCGPCAPA